MMTLSDTGNGADPVSAVRRESAISAAVVCSLPLFVLAILSVVNPGYVGELFSGIGLWMLGAAGALLALAALAMTLMALSVTPENAADKAASLGPRMTVPMILFVLPAMFLILMGPSVRMVMEGRGAPAHASDMRGCVATGVALAAGNAMSAGDYARVVEACRAAFPE